MLHTKFQSNRPNGSGEDIFRGFTIYRHGGLLRHVTWIKYINFLSIFD